MNLHLALPALAIWGALACNLVTAQTTAPATVPDLCQAAVDPYDVGEERTRFFQAAGADNELSEKEFADVAGKDGAFVRSFDTWAGLRAFDKNGNGTIDWFEADAYRLDLRKRMLAAFDADRDGRLTGAERDAANRALAAKKIPSAAGDSRLPATSPATRPGRRGAALRDETLRQYDADGDGRLNEEERRAAFADLAERNRQERLAQYDADGDGKLSDEERKAIREDRQVRQQPWQDLEARWMMTHFDDDGDGKISPAEEASWKEFRRQLGQVGTDLRMRTMDLDGDGKVTQEEQRAAMVRMMGAGFRIAMRMRQAMDADGDGVVTAGEQIAFSEQTAAALENWGNGLVARHDADRNGKLDAPEREALVAGFRKDLDARYAKFDANGDGRLDGDEVGDFLEDLGREMGVFPPARAGRGAPQTQANSP